MGARDLGRGARRHRRAHPEGAGRGPAEGGHVPPRAAGPRADLPAARLPCLGHRRPQQPHQRLLGLRARGLRLLARARPALARSQQGALHPAALLASRGRPLLQPARPADHRRQDGGRQVLRAGHAPQQHRLDGRLLALALAGHRGRAAPGHRALLLRDGTWDREFVRRWVNWEQYLREGAAGAAGHHGRFEEALKALYAEYTPEFAEAESGVARRAHRGGGARGRPRGQRALHARLAQRRRRQPPRLGSRAGARAGGGAGGRGGHPGRHRALRLEQVGADPADDAAAGQDLERAPDAAGVPARLLRDELSAAAFPEGRPRQARDVLHPGLQPGVDQSGRHVVDRDADRRGQGGAARLPHPHLERDRVVRRLRAADGPRLGAPRPHEPGDARRALDRLPPAGAAGGAREAGASASISRGRPTRPPGSGRSGRRTSSGSSCRGASIRTARSASASTSSHPTGPARSCASRSSTAGSSSTACPACPRPPSARA